MDRVVRTVLGLALAVNVWGIGSPALAKYALDYGDSVTITIRGASQYGGTFQIQPDGMVVIPFLDEFQARGLSVKQLQALLTQRLTDLIHNPQVSIVISTFRPRTATVLGEVSKPGVVVLSRPDQRVIDTIADAGGFTLRALRDDVVILRGDGPNAQRIPVNVEAMMETGDLTNNVRIEPGDRLQVGRNPWPAWQEVLAAGQTVLGAVTTFSALLLLLQRASGNEP
ncbi:MAG: polysaccharide biosynthesis/export family protein [Candidatus Sericytochromatia bacterium]|nr:polysaccharide biosynthesis/export family protein [Candidatus Sericytochromatia bacterium]